jgi:RNA polymerase sporulation-specific sigma factor
MIYFILHVTDTNSFPKPLSAKQEEAAIQRYVNGDEQAKHLLIEHNLRLVAHVVKKYYTQNIDQDDLISIGTIGLIKGINSYKPDKKVKLATYCARCIDNEILMHFRGIKKQGCEISFDDPIDSDNEGNVLTLMDIIAVDDTILEEIDTKNKLVALVRLIKAMPQTEIRKYWLCVTD